MTLYHVNRKILLAFVTASILKYQKQHENDKYLPLNYKQEKNTYTN